MCTLGTCFINFRLYSFCDADRCDAHFLFTLLLYSSNVFNVRAYNDRYLSDSYSVRCMNLKCKCLVMVQFQGSLGLVNVAQKPTIQLSKSTRGKGPVKQIPEIHRLFPPKTADGDKFINFTFYWENIAAISEPVIPILHNNVRCPY